MELTKKCTKIGVGRLCALFGKTRHAYYDMLWHKNHRSTDEEIIVELLLKLKDEIYSQHSISILKMLQPTLESHSIKIGWNRLHEIRAKYKLLHIRKKKYVTTTNSYHRFHKYPNLIKELIPNEPNQVWVADITYIRIGDKFCFLSLLTDVYSRYIVGYCLYKTLATEGPLTALKNAIKDLKVKPKKLIHHSDRGIQYCCDEYTKTLQGVNVEISMAEKGNPYENAIAERMNGVLKENYNLKQVFSSWEEANEKVDSAIRSYNYRRPHGSVEGLTPQEAHQKKGVLKKLWKEKKGFLRHGQNL